MCLAPLPSCTPLQWAWQGRGRVPEGATDAFGTSHATQHVTSVFRSDLSHQQNSIATKSHHLTMMHSLSSRGLLQQNKSLSSSHSFLPHQSFKHASPVTSVANSSRRLVVDVAAAKRKSGGPPAPSGENKHVSFFAVAQILHLQAPFHPGWTNCLVHIMSHAFLLFTSFFHLIHTMMLALLKLAYSSTCWYVVLFP